MFARLKTALSRLRLPTMADREESYLAEATTLADLEGRMRQMDLARIGKATRVW